MSTPTRRSRRGPFGTLLAALSLFIFMIPVMGSSELGTPALRLGFSGVLVAGLWVANEGRKTLTLTALLVLANLLAQWLARVVLDEDLDKALLKSALSAGYLGVLTVSLLRTLITVRSPSSDTLLGGINVYLLLALMFAELHIVIECLVPGSYQHGGAALTGSVGGAVNGVHTSFVYFSLVTITTLGYGDMTPVTPGAQFLSAAEAVVGQLYVAILIGSLVALWISGRTVEGHGVESSPPQEPHAPPTDT